MEFYSANFKNSLGQEGAGRLPLAHLLLAVYLLSMWWKETGCWPFQGSPPHSPSACSPLLAPQAPGNDMSLSKVLSALTMVVMLPCDPLRFLLPHSQTGKGVTDGGENRGECRWV